MSRNTALYLLLAGVGALALANYAGMPLPFTGDSGGSPGDGSDGGGGPGDGSDSGGFSMSYPFSSNSVYQSLLPVIQAAAANYSLPVAVALRQL